MARDARERYDNVAIVLHWVIAALMIFMIFFGEGLIRQEGGESSAAAIGTFLPSLHVSIGVSVFLLTLVRLFWRLRNPPPALPASMAGWEIMVTKLVHSAFYVLMLGLPLTGWLAFSGYAAKHSSLTATTFFGFLPVPHIPDLGLPAQDLHGLGSNVAMVLVILHVLAALKHQFFNRDGLLARMSPH